MQQMLIVGDAYKCWSMVALKGALQSRPFSIGQSAQIFYKEPGLNRNCSDLQL